MNRVRRLAIVLVFGAVLGAAAVMAAVMFGPAGHEASATGTCSINWIGGSGNWNDTTHWDAGRIPTSSDTVCIGHGTNDATTYTVTVNINNAQAGNLLLGDDVNPSVTQTLQIGNAGSSLVGDLNVSGFGTASTNDIQPNAAITVSDGNLNQAGSSQTFTADGGPISVTSPTGSFTISNSTFSWNGGPITGPVTLNNSSTLAFNPAGAPSNAPAPSAATSSDGVFLENTAYVDGGTIPVGARVTEASVSGVMNTDVYLNGNVDNLGTFVITTMANGSNTNPQNARLFNNNPSNVPFTLTNDGTITWDPPGSSGGDRNTQVNLVNDAGHLIEIGANSSSPVYQYYGCGTGQPTTFVQSGTLKVDAGGAFEVNANCGSMTLEPGSTTTVNGGPAVPGPGGYGLFINSATLHVDGGQINGANPALLQNSTLDFSGAPANSTASGTIYLEQTNHLTAATIPASMTLYSAGISGYVNTDLYLDGNVDNKGHLNFTTLANGTNVNPQNSRFFSNNPSNVPFTLTNDGTVTWDPSGSVGGDRNTQVNLVNDAGHLIEVGANSSSPVYQYYGCSTGQPTSFVQSGNFQIDAGGHFLVNANCGSFTQAGGTLTTPGLLELSSATVTFTGGASGSGSAALLVDGTSTLNLNTADVWPIETRNNITVQNLAGGATAITIGSGGILNANDGCTGQNTTSFSLPVVNQGTLETTNTNCSGYNVYLNIPSTATAASITNESGALFTVGPNSLSNSSGTKQINATISNQAGATVDIEAPASMGSSATTRAKGGGLYSNAGTWTIGAPGALEMLNSNCGDGCNWENPIFTQTAGVINNVGQSGSNPLVGMYFDSHHSVFDFEGGQTTGVDIVMHGTLWVNSANQLHFELREGSSDPGQLNAGSPSSPGTDLTVSAAQTIDFGDWCDAPNYTTSGNVVNDGTMGFTLGNCGWSGTLTVGPSGTGTFTNNGTFHWSNTVNGNTGSFTINGVFDNEGSVVDPYNNSLIHLAQLSSNDLTPAGVLQGGSWTLASAVLVNSANGSNNVGGSVITNNATLTFTGDGGLFQPGSPYSSLLDGKWATNNAPVVLGDGYHYFTPATFTNTSNLTIQPSNDTSAAGWCNGGNLPPCGSNDNPTVLTISSGNFVQSGSGSPVTWVHQGSTLQTAAGGSQMSFTSGTLRGGGTYDSPSVNTTGTSVIPGDTAAVTTLAAPITQVTATTIQVVSATGFPTSGNFPIVIGNEQMLVTGGQGTTTWTVVRGQGGSPASTHAAGAPVDSPAFLGSVAFTHNFSLGSGSTLDELMQQVQDFNPNTLTFTPANQWSQVNVGGAATIDPAAALSIDSTALTPNLTDAPYQIISAAGGLTGTFTFPSNVHGWDLGSGGIYWALSYPPTGAPTGVSLVPSQRTVTVTPALSTVNSPPAGNAIWNVTLSAPTENGGSVLYSTFVPTTAMLHAIPGQDYTPVTDAAVNIPAGQTTAQATVAILNSGHAAPDKDYGVAISGPSANLSLGTPSQGTQIIHDTNPDPTVSISQTTTLSSVNVGVNPVNYAISLSGVSEKTITVNWATADGSATAPGDYQAASGTVTFQPLQTSATVTVNVVGGTTYKLARNFSVNLSSPTNATILTGSVTTTIPIQGTKPALSINAGLTVVASTTSSQTLDVPVLLSTTSGAATSVHYATADGTAIAGVDYTAASGTLTIPAGSNHGVVAVTILADTTYNPPRQFTVTLSSPVNSTIATGAGTSTETIDTSATPPTLSLSGPATVTAPTSGTTTANYTITQSAASGMATTVFYSTQDGTARAGTDYVGIQPPVQATIPAGQTTATFQVTIDATTVNNVDKNYSVLISGEKNATLVTGGSSVVTSIHNPVAAPTVSIAGPSGATTVPTSGTAAMPFTISLSAPSGQSVTVAYATGGPGETAVPGRDYSVTTGTALFAPGTTSQTIDVPVVGTTESGPNSTVVMAISNPTNATLGTATTAGGGITNSNPSPAVSVTAPAAPIYAPSSGTATATFAVTLNAASYNTVTVSYASQDGTAKAGTNYTAVSGSLTFSPGQVRQSVPVTIDSEAPGSQDLTFSVNLSAPVNATLASGESSSTGTIISPSSLARTSTVAVPTSTTYSESAHPVTLTATVTSPYTTVNSGTVTFTLFSGSTQVGNPVTSGTVASNTVSAAYSLPANTPLGTYTIQAVYNPGTGFQSSSDASHLLRVTKAKTVTSPGKTTVTFNTSAQSANLSATVTSPAGVVSQGTVTFTVLEGTTVIGTPTTSATVTSGAASVSYTLPAGTPAGMYNIQTAYNPGTDFLSSSKSAKNLTVRAAATTTTAQSVSAPATSSSVTLSATVTSPAGPVNEGTVTFTVVKAGTVIGTPTTSSTVSGGSASVSYTLPAGTPAGTYIIKAKYNHGSDYAGSSDDSHTLTLT